MTTTAVTMEELESEHAELLPSRETLTTCGNYSHHSSGNSYSFSSVNQYGAGNVNGSHNFLSGDGNINVSNNQIVIL
jgi:hypothetical protein